MPDRFSFDGDAARAYLASKDEDDLPHVWIEHPARSIEEMFAELSGHVHLDLPSFLTAPDGCSIELYPLVYENDPDGMLLAVSRPGRPRLASYPRDWDDIGDRDHLDRHLTPDEAVEIVDEIVRIANELLDEEETAA